ncbi:MAG: AIM24 family protein [Clostridium sp.]
MTSLVSGEGYVCKFQGPGEIWIQTKNPSYLTSPGS